jgi:acetamidase/formamidase
MLGCVGTAPANNAAFPTTFPDNFGGNMDYNGMGAGATVMLPVFELGALFFLGDGHARQGDGEVLGNAIETSLDVEFSVDLIKNKINWPASKTRTSSWCLAVREPSMKLCSTRRPS